MHRDSLTLLGLAMMCQTCESEIDLLDDAADRGVCRHCGVGFLLDADTPSSHTLSVRTA